MQYLKKAFCACASVAFAELVKVRFVISEKPKITIMLSETTRTFPIATRREVELIFSQSY